MRKEINEIRILPNSDKEFSTEIEFKNFIEKTLKERGGIYNYQSRMKCQNNTLVLFQYRGKIRAVGILEDTKDQRTYDEIGIEYKGCYEFDVNSMCYLNKPISADEIKQIDPGFKGFSQAKQIIDLGYKDAVVRLLHDTNGYRIITDSEFIDEIEKSNLVGVEKEALVRVRVNQGYFRNKLLKKYNKCCLCNVKSKELLIASHIKPWAASNKNEKLDENNGFLLCPNHDALFDKGFITFEDDGKIKISKLLSEQDKLFLNVKNDMKIALNDENRKYLEYHRGRIFKKEIVN